MQILQVMITTSVTDVPSKFQLMSLLFSLGHNYPNNVYDAFLFTDML